MGMITEVRGNVLTGVMRVVCRVARETADYVVAPVALRHEQGTDREAKEVAPLAFEEYVAHLQVMDPTRDNEGPSGTVATPVFSSLTVSSSLPMPVWLKVTSLEAPLSVVSSLVRCM